MLFRIYQYNAGDPDEHYTLSTVDSDGGETFFAPTFHKFTTVTRYAVKHATDHGITAMAFEYRVADTDTHEGGN